MESGRRVFCYFLLAQKVRILIWKIVYPNQQERTEKILSARSANLRQLTPADKEQNNTVLLWLIFQICAKFALPVATLRAAFSARYAERQGNAKLAKYGKWLPG